MILFLCKYGLLSVSTISASAIEGPWLNLWFFPSSIKCYTKQGQEILPETWMPVLDVEQQQENTGTEKKDTKRKTGHHSFVVFGFQHAVLICHRAASSISSDFAVTAWNFPKGLFLNVLCFLLISSKNTMAILPTWETFWLKQNAVCAYNSEHTLQEFGHLPGACLFFNHTSLKV